MKCIYMLSLFCYVSYSSSQYAPNIRKPVISPCDNPNRNSLIEHFFNIIFTEFYSTPPVCVCVQMCLGESTYCFPNGCLRAKSEISTTMKSIDVPLAPQNPTQRNAKQFMLVADDKYDFMSDLLERNYVDELWKKRNYDYKTTTPNMTPAEDLRPDPFIDKYNILGKYFKRPPKVELRYNIREQVKNSKSDLVKNEGSDLTKTRWPLNRHHRGLNGMKLFPEADKPFVNKANYFSKMFTDNEVAEYPPKYFKRDLTRTTDADDVNSQPYYVFENTMNSTEENATFSLETLIDNLIRTSVSNINTNENAKKDETQIETKAPIQRAINENSTGLANETTSIISMNFTNENVDRNKYADISPKINRTRSLSEMISYLAKQIEKQNNTSREIAKRIIGDLDETTSNWETSQTEKYLQATTEVNNFNLTSSIEASYKTKPATDVSMTTTEETQVTKKNRQRVLRKSPNSKLN